MAFIKPPFPRIQRGRFISNGLVAAWPFYEGSGGVLHDVLGNGNHGTISGNPAWIAGIHGHVLSFDGSGDWIDIPNGSPAKDVFNGGTEFSVSVWGRIDGLFGDNSLIMTDPKAAGSQFILWRDRDANVSGRTNTVSLLVSNGTSDQRLEAADGSWNDNLWHNVIVTYSVLGGSIRVFIDGREDPNSPVSDVGALKTNTNPIRFGADTSGGHAANGDVDDTRIYNRPLSPSEAYLIAAGLG